MGIEIERRFLVRNEDWRAAAQSAHSIRQAYLAVTAAVSVRVRITDEQRAVLTIKDARPALRRAEFEYPVPMEEAESLIALRTGNLLEKQRYIVPQDGMRWEIDAFSGDLDGLIIAEIELEEETTPFVYPDWLGREITGEERYSNARLALEGLVEP